METTTQTEYEQGIFDIGRPVEVKLSNGTWVPGTVTGFRASADPNEDFLRIDVKNKTLGFVWNGCHPDCVRIATGEGTTHVARHGKTPSGDCKCGALACGRVAARN